MIAGIIPFYGHCRIKKCTRVLSIFIVGSMLSTIFNAEIFGGGGVASGQVGKKSEERYETQEDQRESLISLLVIADLYFETNKYNQNLYKIIYGSSPKEKNKYLFYYDIYYPIFYINFFNNFLITNKSCNLFI